jgi:hypothetical protein
VTVFYFQLSPTLSNSTYYLKYISSQTNLPDYFHKKVRFHLIVETHRLEIRIYARGVGWVPMTIVESSSSKCVT